MASGLRGGVVRQPVSPIGNDVRKSAYKYEPARVSICVCRARRANALLCRIQDTGGVYRASRYKNAGGIVPYHSKSIVMSHRDES